MLPTYTFTETDQAKKDLSPRVDSLSASLHNTKRKHAAGRFFHSSEQTPPRHQSTEDLAERM